MNNHRKLNNTRRHAPSFNAKVARHRLNDISKPPVPPPASAPEFNEDAASPANANSNASDPRLSNSPPR